ncbi:hypothetical protein, partial [Cupriavidus sp. RAF12]|uniref:hypothetical protein n=1 Tax=Cupriavidus sp. RAF12 TaxID=3233050 RepID=UPI003F92D1C8
VSEIRLREFLARPVCRVVLDCQPAAAANSSLAQSVVSSSIANPLPQNEQDARKLTPSAEVYNRICG